MPDNHPILTIPGSKSIALRVLIIATFLDTSLSIKNLPKCNDVLTLMRALQRLGFRIDSDGDQTFVTPWPVKSNHSVSVYIQDSAAALRFLAVRLAVLPGVNSKIELSPQLKRRPIVPLVELINIMGGNADYDGQFVIINGEERLSFDRKAEKYLALGQTSQLASALLLCSPSIFIDHQVLVSLLRNDHEKVSHKYLELTIGVMKDFGMVEDQYFCQEEGDRRSFNYANPRLYGIEPDFSSACYFWALGCMINKPIAIRIDKLESLQPDYRFLFVLSNMGARVTKTRDWISVEADSLQAVLVSMKDMPDQVPTLAVLAMITQGKVAMSDVDHLRYKESDRLAALLTGLKKIGADIVYRDRVLKVTPLTAAPPAVTIDCRDDHRLVMAFSLLKELYPQIKIAGSEAVRKSFPDFFHTLDLCRK